MDKKLFENMWKMMRENNFDYSDESSSDLRCRICNKILIDACNSPCGCCFCKLCINQYLNEGRRKCPGQSEYCSDELLDINRDIQGSPATNVRIRRLPVKCPNIGCQEQVEMRMMENHLRICERQPQPCPYLELGCGESKLDKDQIRDHLTMEIYSHTKILINWMSNSRNEMEFMKTEVEKLRADNDELKEKMRSDGEGMKEIFRDLEKREKENREEIEILNEEMCFLKNCNRSMKDELKAVKEEHGEQICQLEGQVKNQGQEIETLKQRCQQAESRCDEIRQEAQKSHDMQMELDEISQASAAIKSESMATTKSMENMNKIIDQTIFVEFVWKIDNWAAKARKARKGIDGEIFSDSFLTHQNGFKICLALRFGGIFWYIGFCILSGPFDAILRWPFDRYVEFSLMNQKSRLAHKTWNIECSEYPKRVELQQPKKENKNKPFYDSYNLFILPGEISSNPGICQNDEIFIKCSSRPAEHRK